MTTLREVFIAAVKSLLRGKNFIQALLTLWISPNLIKNPGCESSSNVTLDVSKERRSPDDFLREVEDLFLQPIQGNTLKEFSSKLKSQFREGLLNNPACMLPSYNHQLPSRSERGQYLALDVGGSTLRVALVELEGREAVGRESRIVRLDSFKIGREVKNLAGMSFFDWMAQKIVATVSSALGAENSPTHPLLMGLAWSFPIEQISHKGGRLQGMGKGFLASDGLLGQDLGDIIKSACQSRGIHVELAAIVNDSTAALLSEAYLNSSTRFGLILGTGVNIAVHLPVPTIGREKFGERPASWFDKASHVIVNTELGMFGKGILPLTRWDVALNASHLRPNFQPLEHLVSGCYLGEVCRLVLLEAINTTGLFGGVVPPSLLLPYSLDTETLSIIEADTSTSLEPSVTLFKSRHPSPIEPTPVDIASLRTLASYISRRSSAIVAASLFALWEFKNEAESQHPSVNSLQELNMDNHVVAFNGSVIEQYPQYLENCQHYINALLSSAEGKLGTISLVGAKESSLLGAAVALACLEDGKAN
ncbi:N-acetylglucosamine kinase 1 [Gnomoniopsis smithogilvyi]|uniref:Phosphotransferase n=1 Tax=Gnomoniopsis smithogilvyi TaxID=1191159 RepID=A0A9W9CZ57_9PEZI|nr:N-acetylglucosamine kinase 1 [Gnomoniopsis smithogilvyi]